MMLCDEHGRGIIKDWHPNGHLRTFESNNYRSHYLQYQWEHTVIDNNKNDSIITETEWRKIPHENIEKSLENAHDNT